MDDELVDAPEALMQRFGLSRLKHAAGTALGAEVKTVIAPRLGRA